MKLEVLADSETVALVTHLRDDLLSHAPLRPEQLHAMPVEEEDLAARATRYARTLQEPARSSPGPPAVVALRVAKEKGQDSPRACCVSRRISISSRRDS
jgi:hypothetical protein